MTYPKNKYRKGHPIYSMDTLIYEHLEAGKWVYLRDKVVHPSVIRNMTLNKVDGFLKSYLLHEAIDQQKEHSKKVTEDCINANLR
jgi:hypothetical protein